jgi:hypothetical protein
MKHDPGAALRPAAQSDTIPILNADLITRIRGVVRVRRGGCQTRKASDLIVLAGGSPSFGTAPAHHRTPAPRPLHGDQRLTVSHGITGICGNRMRYERGNAACAAERFLRRHGERSTLNNVRLKANRVLWFLKYKYYACWGLQLFLGA